LARGDLATGFIYFRLPNDRLLDSLGRCRLLFSTSADENAGERYVVDLQVYKAKSKN
jgi:hypothetical protein